MSIKITKNSTAARLEPEREKGRQSLPHILPEKLLSGRKVTGQLSSCKKDDGCQICQVGNTLTVLPEDLDLEHYKGLDIIITMTDSGAIVRERGTALS
jgi:hypothetical protein